MLILAATAAAIRVITTSAASVNVHASWVDNASGTITPDGKNTSIATAATTVVVAGPAAGAQRNVQTLTVRNVDATLSAPVKVAHYDGAAAAVMIGATLLPDESLQFVDGDGWAVFTAAGSRKDGASTAKKVPYPLGGSKETGKATAAWVPVPSAQRVLIDGDAYASARAILEMRTTDVATSVQLRVRNLTTGADAALSTAITVTDTDYNGVNQRQVIALTLAAGENLYELQVIGGNAATDVLGNGYVEAQ